MVNSSTPFIFSTIGKYLFFSFVGKSLYEVSMVDWNIWTNKIKKPLIKGLFKEYLSVGTEVYPSQPHVRFERIIYKDAYFQVRKFWMEIVVSSFPPKNQRKKLPSFFPRI